LALCTAALLVFPKVRKRERLLGVICAAVIVAIWIEKGMGLVVTGFIPNPLNEVTEYTPTGTEVAITFGVYGIGFLVLTALYKIVVNVRERNGHSARAEKGPTGGMEKVEEAAAHP
jgi:molybdopterin-containing oxidoreductase family membrane subunit